MISLYEGSGYTKYILRSGLELTLHEDDFREMLGFKDEMARWKVRCNNLNKENNDLVDEIIVLEYEIKKFKGKLLWVN